MNKTLLYCIFSLLATCNSNKETTKKIEKKDFQQAKIAFTELKEKLEDEGGELWNHGLDGPLLMVNRETRTIIANEPDAAGELKSLDGFYTGILPENINIANTITTWNDEKWIMVMFPLPETREERLRLLIHESFHRIQPLIGFDSLIDIPNNHLDTKEGRIYLKMEIEALKAALDSENPDYHIRNALLFRHYRHSLFPGSKVKENLLELLEGLAEYTGVILCGKTDDELKIHFEQQLRMLSEMPSFMRSFAYYTVPVYGYFMQKKDKIWNLDINKRTCLTDYITEFYNMTAMDLSVNNITHTGKTYNIDNIIKTEEIIENARLERNRKYKAQFLGDSVFIIDLIRFNMSFDPRNMVPLDSFGTVYPNMRISDKWGILEVDSGGVLLSSDFRTARLTLPVFICDTLITGNGWKLHLDTPRELEKYGGMWRLRR